MELNNEFRVAVPAAKTWEFLTDVERVAPCLPGATLLSVDGDEFTGTVKVKVGPITVSYKGEAAFAEKDAAAQRMVLKATGKETRGNGNVAAVITAQLKDEGSDAQPATRVLIHTDLTISGKAAQFGRGVLADVAGHLIGQFAASLESELLGVSAPTATETPSAATGAEQGDVIDTVALVKAVAPSVAKRYAPVAAGLAAGVVIGLLIGRRRKRAHPAAVLADDLQAALTRLLS